MWIFHVTLTLLLGWNLPFAQLILSWLLLLVLPLSTLSVVFLIVALVRHDMGYGIGEPTATTEALPQSGPMTNARTRAMRAGKYLGIVILSIGVGWFVGWLWRDHQLSSPLRIYTDVLVTSRYDNTHFELAPARMSPWTATTCLPVDWKAGEKMKFLAFQQRAPGCKDVTVNGWYEFYNDERNGKRINFKEVTNAGN